MNENDKRLGMGTLITRRDFVNSTLLGAGVGLLHAQAPWAFAQSAQSTMPEVPAEWYGYGGVGDYARSHGNTPAVVNAAHKLRDGNYPANPEGLIETEEVYDLVIVGAGFAGLGAAWEHHKQAGGAGRCLIIDNHPVFGGEGKRNEFEVDGYKLIGPQGSNGFSVPNSTEDRERSQSPDHIWMRELGVPFDFEYGTLTNSDKGIKLSRDDYGYQYWQEDTTSVVHFFKDPETNEPMWVLNPLENNYRDLPYGEQDKKDLYAWRNSAFETPDVPDVNAWLDTMTYQQFLEDVLGFSNVVTRWVSPIVAGSVGLGADAISARGASGPKRGRGAGAERSRNPRSSRVSLPGGNDTLSRYFVKKMMPHAITGGESFQDIVNGSIVFDSLDGADQPLRMRLESTVVRVEHEGNLDDAELVSVIYEKAGTPYRIRAKRVVMASGGWVNKHVVVDLPATHHEAYEHFHYVPFLVANVAVRQWRFMERLGAGAFMWENGVFGTCCNIRLPMVDGYHLSELDPDKPAVISFYVPFMNPGLSNSEQGETGRWEMFSTSYADYERQIRTQMVELFGPTGFDPEADIAGIVLNRWGHAYVAPQPGFYHGTNGQPAPRDVIARRFGRIAIGHGDMDGNQHWSRSANQGQRAARLLSDAD